LALEREKRHRPAVEDGDGIESAGSALAFAYSKPVIRDNASKSPHTKALCRVGKALYKYSEALLRQGEALGRNIISMYQNNEPM
jgi:hypothetical protein